MALGFRIRARRRQFDPVLLERFAGLPVANVSDVMSRMAAGGARLRPMHDGSPMAGPALTVKTRPGDNLMVHKALDLAQPGDIVVVDAGGDCTNSIIGELMVAHAIFRRIGGIVIHGAIRDSAAIAQGNFPVYAVGVTHRGPYRDGPGEINVSVALDGMVIEPGDLVLGDADGLVCVPIDHADAIAKKAREKFHLEEAMREKANRGGNDRSWIDAALTKLGCEIEAD
jgi:regulator of RNase E activity RraA